MTILNMVGGGENKNGKKFYNYVLSMTQPATPTEGTIWIKTDLKNKPIKIIDNAIDIIGKDTIYLVISDELVDIDLSMVSNLYNTNFEDMRFNKTGINKFKSDTHLKLQQWGRINTYAIPCNVVYVDSLGIKKKIDASAFINNKWLKFTNEDLLMVWYQVSNPQNQGAMDNYKLFIFDPVTRTKTKEISGDNAFWGHMSADKVLKRIHPTDPTNYIEYDYNLNIITPAISLTQIKAKIPYNTSYLWSFYNQIVYDYANNICYTMLPGSGPTKCKISDGSVLISSNPSCVAPYNGVCFQSEKYICYANHNSGYAFGFSVFRKSDLAQVYYAYDRDYVYQYIKDDTLFYITQQTIGDEYEVYNISTLHAYDLVNKKELYTRVGSSILGIDDNNLTYFNTTTKIIVCNGATEIASINYPKALENTQLIVTKQGLILYRSDQTTLIAISPMTGQEVYKINLNEFCLNRGGDSRYVYVDILNQS